MKHLDRWDSLTPRERSIADQWRRQNRIQLREDIDVVHMDVKGERVEVLTEATLHKARGPERLASPFASL